MQNPMQIFHFQSAEMWKRFKKHTCAYRYPPYKLLNSKLKGKSRLPGPDIQFTPVDDAGELKENREPTPHPHTVLGRYIHIITGVVFEGLPEK